MILYIYTNRTTGLKYIGKTEQSFEARDAQHIADSRRSDTKFHKALREFGRKDFDVEIISCEGFTSEQLKKFERDEIIRLDTYRNGYNSNPGGAGITSEEAQRRVEEGTHNWLGPESNRRRIENGTHPLVGENNPSHRRVEEGTHNFLGPEMNRSRIEAGTHNLVGENNPSHRRVEEGTHHFLVDPPMSTKNRHRRLIENGQQSLF